MLNFIMEIIVRYKVKVSKCWRGYLVLDKWIYFRADKIVYCRLPTLEVNLSRVFIHLVNMLNTKYTKLISYRRKFNEKCFYPSQLR